MTAFLVILTIALSIAAVVISVATIIRTRRMTREIDAMLVQVRAMNAELERGW